MVRPFHEFSLFSLTVVCFERTQFFYVRHKSSQFSAQKARYRAVGAGRHGGKTYFCRSVLPTYLNHGGDELYPPGHVSDVASGWTGYLEFVRSVNPIPTRGGGRFMPTTLLLAHPDLKT